MPKFQKNKTLLPPDTHTYVFVSGGKKCLFFGNFGMLCFLETPVLKFALLSYSRRYHLELLSLLEVQIDLPRSYKDETVIDTELGLQDISCSYKQT